MMWHLLQKRKDKYLSLWFGEKKRVEYERKTTLQSIRDRDCRIIKTRSLVWWDTDGCICVGPKISAVTPYLEIQCRKAGAFGFELTYKVTSTCRYSWCGWIHHALAHQHTLNGQVYEDMIIKELWSSLRQPRKYYVVLTDYLNPSIGLVTGMTRDRYYYYRDILLPDHGHIAVKLGGTVYKLEVTSRYLGTFFRDGELFNLRIESFSNYTPSGYMITCLCNIGFGSLA